MRSSTNECEAQSQASKEFAKVYEASSKENSKAKQDDSVSKLVTAVFMRQTYTKCNFCNLNNVGKLRIADYVTDGHRVRRCPLKSNQGNC